MSFSKQQKNFGWRTSDYFDLIHYPIFTEKTDNLRAQNQYTFAVDPSLTKTEIKLAIQELFNVKVTAVNTAVIKTEILKKKRFRRGSTFRKRKFKKAIVTLAPKNSIDLLQIK